MCTGSGNCQRPVLCRGIDQEDLAVYPSLHSILFYGVRLGSARLADRPRFFLEETGYILAKPLISFRELAPARGYFSNRNKHSWKTYCYEERDCQTIAYPSPINWRMVVRTITFARTFVWKERNLRGRIYLCCKIRFIVASYLYTRG